MQLTVQVISDFYRIRSSKKLTLYLYENYLDFTKIKKLKKVCPAQIYLMQNYTFTLITVFVCGQLSPEHFYILEP